MTGLELIREFVDAMNRHDVDALAALYAADAKIIYPGRELRLPLDYAEDERAMLLSVPDYHIEPLTLVEADGGRVLLELQMSGTQREDLGGRSFSVTGAYIFTVSGGRICEEHAYPDMAGLRRQLSDR